MDKFNFGSGSETFVMVEYEKAASLSAMTNGQFFKIADAGSGQPLDFDVRFVKSDKAKLAYFMPPPQLSLADGATVQIDGVNIVSRSGNNVTFDNTTVSSVWDFKNAKSITGAINASNNGMYDYDISTSAGKNYKIMLNKNGTVIKVEFFEMQVGGGGAPTGGPGGPGGGMMTMLMGGENCVWMDPTHIPHHHVHVNKKLLTLSSTGLITLLLQVGK